jgi:6-phosphogluconolactonase
MSDTIIKISKTPNETAHEFANFLADDIAQTEKLYTLALSGGSTPKLLFTILAEEYKDKIDWQKIHFFWGDDRMVAVSNPQSNYGEAKRILFEKIKIPRCNLHPIDGLIPPNIEADRYAEKINLIVPKRNGLPCFSMVLLGLGEDGHTASIFPNQMCLLSSDKICEPAWHPQTKQPRVTITGKTVNNAQKIAFLVTGAAKAEKISEIINTRGSYLTYPAAHIAPVHGKLFWYLDKEAGKLIHGYNL